MFEFFFFISERQEILCVMPLNSYSNSIKFRINTINILREKNSCSIKWFILKLELEYLDLEWFILMLELYS